MNDITITVNNEVFTLNVNPNKRLLDVLREDLHFTGTKEGCGEGECGACSILMDDLLVNSCLVPVIQADGKNIITIEGYTKTPSGQILVDAFSEAHSSQCGFCTPGMLLAAASLLKNNPNPSEADIREALSGNICRCTGYDMIVDGILLAAERGKKEQGAFTW